MSYASKLARDINAGDAIYIAGTTYDVREVHYLPDNDEIALGVNARGTACLWTIYAYPEAEYTMTGSKCDCDAGQHPSVIAGEYVHSESCPLYE